MIKEKLDKENLSKLKEYYESITSLLPELKHYFDSPLNTNLNEIEKTIYTVKFFCEKMLEVIHKK